MSNSIDAASVKEEESIQRKGGLEPNVEKGLYKRSLLVRHGGTASSQELKKSNSPIKLKHYVEKKKAGVPSEDKDFVRRNILQTSDMQAIIERFIVGKYQEQLF